MKKTLINVLMLGSVLSTGICMADEVEGDAEFSKAYIRWRDPSNTYEQAEQNFNRPTDTLDGFMYVIDAVAGEERCDDDDFKHWRMANSKVYARVKRQNTSLQYPTKPYWELYWTDERPLTEEGTYVSENNERRYYAKHVFKYEVGNWNLFSFDSDVGGYRVFKYLSYCDVYDD